MVIKALTKSGGVLALRENAPGKVLEGHRAADPIALRDVAAEFREPRQGFIGLDTFGDHMMTE